MLKKVTDFNNEILFLNYNIFLKYISNTPVV